ncbi:MAG: S-layer homology domain-containing protein, partial [Oscillospiraceae bacterium]|nr:S-layer homology domain-containing protein [Oscillospiraceae bacterium]
MKRRIFHRISSMLLTITMLISLLPTAAFAVKVVDPFSVTFGFYDGGRSDVSKNSDRLENKNGVWTSGYAKYPDEPASPGENWAYLGTSVNKGYAKNQYVIMAKYAATSSETKAGEWLAFKIKLPKTANYSVSGTAYHSKSDNKNMQIYIIPMNETLKETFKEGNVATYGTVTAGDPSTRTGAKLFSELNIDPECLVGSADMSLPVKTVQAMTITNSKSVPIEANKDYILLFNAGVDGIMRPATITLTAVESSLPSGIELSVDNTSVTLGREAQASVFVKDGNGNEYLGGYTVKYESSTPGVVAIDEDSGKITTQGVGETTIKVTVTSGTFEETDTVLFTVTEPAVLKSLIPERSTIGVVAGGNEKIRISALMSDGNDGNISDYTLSYSGYDADVISVDNDGVITGIMPGQTTVTVSTENKKGTFVSEDIEINVVTEAETVLVDFKKTVIPGDSGEPTSTPGYELLADEMKTTILSFVNYPDAKKVHKATGSKDLTWPKNKHENNPDINNTFAFAVNIPYSGYYNMSVLGGLYYRGAEYSVFVDDMYMGDHSFYIEQSKGLCTDETKKLNTVYLEAGKRKVYFRMRSAQEYSTTYVIIDTVTFTPVKESEVDLEKIEAHIPTEMAVGEIIDGTAVTYMSDGSIRHFGMTSGGDVDYTNKITASSSGGAVELSGFNGYKIGATGKNPYRLTAMSEGKSEVVFTAVLDGKIVTKKETVNVSVDPIKSTTATTETCVSGNPDTVFEGDSTRLIPTVKLESDRVIDSPAVTTVFSVYDESKEIASVEGDVITGLHAGRARIKVASTFNGETVYKDIYVEILPEGMTSVKITAGGSEHIRLTDDEVQESVPLYVQAISNIGRELDMSKATVEAVALTENIAVIDESLHITPISAGEAKFKVTVNYNNKQEITETVTFYVAKGKGKATYMTEEEAQIARDNIKKYAWAKDEAREVIQNADNLTDILDTLYDMVPSEGLPRMHAVGHKEDPHAYMCRYCGCDIRAKYGAYAWLLSPLNDPWKIKCPDCSRQFPSNDFGKFYKLGINEYGEFDRIRALENHRDMLIKNGEMNDVTDVVSPGAEYSENWLKYYGYGKGYLKNTSFTELYTSDIDPFYYNTDLDGDKKADEKEVHLYAGYGKVTAGMLWGVDDGFGYVPINADGTPRCFDSKNTIVERHAYIGFYIHAGIWYDFSYGGGVIEEALHDSSYAYFYTGDVKYGRVAAILLDRVADFYPDLSLGLYRDILGNSNGKAINRVWETANAEKFIRAYDMVFELYETDPFVMNYIRNKASVWKMRNAKNTPSQVRTHIESNIIRAALEGLKTNQVNGNFGMDQKVNAIGAIVLDSEPETEKWLEFLLAPGWESGESAASTGGSVNLNLVDEVDADGHGDEGSGYNVGWHRNIIRLDEAIEDSEYYEAFTMFNNPKFKQMYYSTIPMMSTYYTPQIGDTDSTLSETHWMAKDIALHGWMHLKDPIFAQMLYKINGDSTEGLHYDITEPDPERLEDEVRDVIEQYGTYKFKTDMMTNFGFAILRDGDDFSSSANASSKDTRRDTWMYFGTSLGAHPHQDTLNLGMTAFGLNYMPDLGYPARTGDDPNRNYWIDTTLSHNTVVVDEKRQDENGEIRGKVKHFDGKDGTVSLMDVSAPYVYSGERANSAKVDEYRRSVVQIHVDAENSYMVDFFRVLGGNSHIYSLHATSNEIADVSGLELTPQMKDGKYVGSYAGPDVPYGEEMVASYPMGYTWIKNIDRDEDPENKIEIDFAIKDFNRSIEDSSGLHLKMTMLNGTNVKLGADVNVAIGDGLPPQKAENKNIDKLKYVLVENEGTNLDTTFTTVFEPYRSESFIKSVDELEMKITDAGTPEKGDASRAIRIEHVNGRVDYVFYSTNNTVTYEICDGEGEDAIKLAFRGFVGVYTLQSGANTYSYIHDGDILGKPLAEAKGAIEGKVVSFTKDHLEKNEMVIEVKNGELTDAEISDLTNRYIFVDNGAETRSGSFKILGAERVFDNEGNSVPNNIRLDIGRITPIRQHADILNPGAGYIYMIAEGQDARIPVTVSTNNSPVFTNVPERVLTVSAGSSINVDVVAESPVKENPPQITYIGTTLPRGASVDANTGKVTWKPNESQIGENHFAITARDALGSESTACFTVMVYGSTTGKPSTDNEPADTPSGGGGGGGGGAAPAPDTDDDTKPDDGNNAETPSDDTGENSPDSSGETEQLHFTDIKNHSWAEAAIVELSEKGIIKGTSKDTFSPASNITRADFALLLVRAFGLSSDNTENFADVLETDYFATELAVARNTGIVGGIGDNKYAPRNTITRQ